MTLPTITILILGLLIIISKISGFSQYVKNNKYLQVIILFVLLCFILYNGLNMQTFGFQEITGISVLIILFVLGSFTFFKKYLKNRNG
jgi:hypothetical protein